MVAVVRREDRSVVYSSDPAAGMGAAQPGDVQRGIPGRGGRPMGDRPGGDPPGAGPRPAVGERAHDGARDRDARWPPEEESPWLVVARHRGGSLEESVARVRRRNLGVGLGVLALLGATAVLLATGAQRARRLAQQQMEFVAGVTHELNTPLAAIRSAGQNLADGIVTDPAQVRRYGGLIEKEGGRLTALVAQVLDFAGIESGSRAYATEPVSVARLVDEVLRDHRLALEQAGMTVERDLAPDLPDVRGDAGALRRVLDNLVANAVKFAAGGRWLAVRAEARRGRGRGGPAGRGPRPGHPARRARAGLRALLPRPRGGAERDTRQRPRAQPRPARGPRARRPGPRGGARGRGAALVLVLPVAPGGETKA